MDSAINNFFFIKLNIEPLLNNIYQAEEHMKGGIVKAEMQNETIVRVNLLFDR